MKTQKTKHEELFTDGDVAVPMSFRLPVKVATLLYKYATEMNTSSGKFLATLLEDALPAFEDGEPYITLRMVKVYQAMKGADLLRAVNTREIADRMLGRTDPNSEQQGRPAKKREVNL